MIQLRQSQDNCLTICIDVTFATTLLQVLCKNNPHVNEHLKVVQVRPSDRIRTEYLKDCGITEQSGLALRIIVYTTFMSYNTLRYKSICTSNKLTRAVHCIECSSSFSVAKHRNVTDDYRQLVKYSINLSLCKFMSLQNMNVLPYYIITCQLPSQQNVVFKTLYVKQYDTCSTLQGSAIPPV